MISTAFLITLLGVAIISTVIGYLMFNLMSEKIITFKNDQKYTAVDIQKLEQIISELEKKIEWLIKKEKK